MKEVKSDGTEVNKLVGFEKHEIEVESHQAELGMS